MNIDELLLSIDENTPIRRSVLCVFGEDDEKWVDAPSSGEGDYMEDTVFNVWLEKLYAVGGDIAEIGGWIS